jgi:hypothetical protein
MASTAFSSIQRRADVARAFAFDVKTVTRIRCLIASCGMSADRQFALLLASDFEREHPTAFVSSLAADATTERLVLPFMGLEDMTESGKSAWHVLVSGQKFFWASG